MKKIILKDICKIASTYVERKYKNTRTSVLIHP